MHISRMRQCSARRVLWQAVWPDQLPAHLIREMFVTLWQRQGWPQQAMTFDHWNRLAQLAQATGSNVADATLPGKIRARRDHRYLEIACPPPESPSEIQPNLKP